MHIKKITAVLLVVLLLVSLAGCGDTPQPSQPLTTESPGGTTAPGGTDSDPVVPTTDEVRPGVLDVDLTEPWVKPDLEDAYCAAFSDVGYYYKQNGFFLSFMDTENGISVILCQKVGCEHKKEDCEAYLPMSYVMFYTDGYIYYNKLVPYDASGVHLFRRKADGTGEEKVALLGGEYVSKDVSVQVGEFLAAEGALYYTLYTLEVVKENEDDPGVVVERDGILVRLDLNTGKQQELLRQRNVLIRLFGARGNALLFHALDKPSAEQIGEPDYFEKLARKHVRLQVWSASGGITTLFDKQQKDCSWFLGLQGGKVYYYDQEDVLLYDLAKNEHIVTDLPYGFQLVNQDYIIVGAEQINKFYDLRTGEYLPSDFEAASMAQQLPDNFDTASMAVKNRTDRGCILELRYNGARYVDEYGQTVIPRLRTILGYVSFDALADGLQESDLLIIQDVQGK